MHPIPAALIGLLSGYLLLALMGGVSRRRSTPRPTPAAATPPPAATIQAKPLTDDEMARVVAELTYFYARIGGAKHLPGAELYSRDPAAAALLDRATEEDRASAYVQAGAHVIDIAVNVIAAATDQPESAITRNLVSAAAFDRETFHMST